MKVAIKEFIVINQFINRISTQDLPVNVAYKLNKIMKSSKEIDEFYTTRLKAIADKYGERDEDNQLINIGNGSIKVREDSQTACDQEMSELLDYEIEIPDYKIKLSDLNSLSLSMIEMEAFDKFIEE